MQLWTTLIVPQVSRGENNKRFERLFDETYLAPAGQITPAVEILLVKEVGAIVTVHVRLSEAITVPVGFVLCDPKTISVLEGLLRTDEMRKFAVIWHRAPEPVEAQLEADNAS